MSDELAQLLADHAAADEKTVAQTEAIAEEILASSPWIDSFDFESVHPVDLEALFDEYDARFFQGLCRETAGNRPLTFRLSRRMTRTGGTTTHFRPRWGGQERFEIAVSSTLLFQAFDDDHRSIRVGGLVCNNRLQALQRIVEHEMVHLVELLVWRTSSCKRKRFQSIANRFFRHTQYGHSLITARERAAVQFGIQPGSQVRFRIDGTEYEGVINRITKRATVLVPSRDGVLYSNGQRYDKWYVPLGLLRAADDG